MTEKKLNQDVLEVLQENTKDDDAVREFIIKLIQEEAGHVKNWRFTKDYDNLIEEYVKKWRGANED